VLDLYCFPTPYPHSNILHNAALLITNKSVVKCQCYVISSITHLFIYLSSLVVYSICHFVLYIFSLYHNNSNINNNNKMTNWGRSVGKMAVCGLDLQGSIAGSIRDFFPRRRGDRAASAAQPAFCLISSG
jgi:hypothetical protein